MPNFKHGTYGIRKGHVKTIHIGAVLTYLAFLITCAVVIGGTVWIACQVCAMPGRIRDNQTNPQWRSEMGK